MVWRVVRIILLVAPLGACSIMHLFNDANDERQAAATITDTGPLVDACHQKFAASLGDMPVSFLNGPTVTHDGSVITVSLEAEPYDRNQLEPKRFSCVFDNGTLTSADPVP